jgi:predicted permease
MFGVIDRLFLRAPPYVQDAGRVGRLHLRAFYPGEGEFITDWRTFPEYQRIRDRVTAFSSVAAYSVPVTVTLGQGVGALHARTVLVSHTFFPLLGVRPALGRFFTRDDDGAAAAPTIVLDHGFWTREFGSDTAVLGRALRVGKRDYTVIGITPPGFTGPDLTPVDAWLPAEVTGPEMSEMFEGFSSGLNATLQIIGRLRPGASFAQAQEQATTAYLNGRPSSTAAGLQFSILIGPIQGARGPRLGGDAVMAEWLGGVSAIVLLIACLNVANLLFARAIRRRREVAIRLAIGAGRPRLVRHLLVEGLLLSALGAVGAAVIVLFAGAPLQAMALPNAVAIHAADPRVLVFTLGLAILTGVLSSLIPAMQATRPDLGVALAAGDRPRGTRFHVGSRLLVGQVTLSVILVVAAGLFLESLRKVDKIDFGFEPDRLLAVTLDLQGLGYARKEGDALYFQMLNRVRSLPGVRSASLATGGPLWGGWAAGIRLPGQTRWDKRGPNQTAVLASIDFAETMGMRLIGGRWLNAGDRPGSEQVAVVGESMAKTYWSGEDAVGKCFFTGDDPACIRVVGVVEDVPGYAITGPPDPVFYQSIDQEDFSVPVRSLFVRTSADPQGIIPVLRREIQALIPGAPFVEVTQMRERIDPQIRPWRLDGLLFGAYGGVALLLTALGIYGVLAYGVTQRTREIGVRMALGANSGAVVGMVLRDALLLTAGGIVTGAVLSLLGGRAVGALLYGVSPRDPVILGIAIAVILAAAFAAAYFPARRAARVDPMIALRYE